MTPNLQKHMEETRGLSYFVQDGFSALLYTIFSNFAKKCPNVTGLVIE